MHDNNPPDQLRGPSHEVTILLLIEMLRSHLRDAPNKSDLKEIEHKIMSAISDFAAKVKGHQDKIDQAVSGLTDDIKDLNDKITQLQNSAGTITPEDQALLDDIESKASAAASKLEALDSLTPPAAPAPTT